MAGLSLAQIPEMAEQIAVMRASGCTQAMIADKLDVAQSTVSEALRTPSLKRRLEIAHAALVNSCLDAAIDNVAYLTNNYRATAPDSDGQDQPVLTGQEKDHAYKATIKMLETVGLAPTHTTSVIVNQTLNVVDDALSPAVRAVLQQLGANLAGTDNSQAIDAEVVSDEGAPCETGPIETGVETGGGA